MCRHRYCNRHHAGLMWAFYSAQEMWAAQREAACSDYAGDIEMWTEDHPQPRLADFMRTYR